MSHIFRDDVFLKKEKINYYGEDHFLNYNNEQALILEINPVTTTMQKQDSAVWYDGIEKDEEVISDDEISITSNAESLSTSCEEMILPPILSDKSSLSISYSKIK